MITDMNEVGLKFYVQKLNDPCFPKYKSWKYSVKKQGENAILLHVYHWTNFLFLYLEKSYKIKSICLYQRFGTAAEFFYP